MKKLIAIAAVALAGAAMAEGQAYNIKMTLKTITDTSVNCKNSVNCTMCTEGQGADTPAVYKQGTVKINGVIANCTDCKTRTAKKTRQTVSAAYFWNKTEDDMIGSFAEIDANTVVAATNAAINVLNRKDGTLTSDFRVRAFGPSATKQNKAVVELDLVGLGVGTDVTFSKNYTLVGSEYGSYNTHDHKDALDDEDTVINGYDLDAIGFGTIKAGLVSSASGNVVGKLPYWNCAALYNVNEISCDDVDYCTLADTKGYERNLRPAYGTFTVKNNTKAGKQGVYFYQVVSGALK